MNYYVVTFYKFVELDDPNHEVKKHKEFFIDKDMKGRIYIAKDGINAQFSGLKEHVDAYLQWIQTDSRFQNLPIKTHEHDKNVFAKMTVKVREQLAAMDIAYDMAKTGVHVSPEKWSEMLDQRDQDTLLIDVRNDYETEVGTFEGAITPDISSFREFPAFAKDLKEKVGTGKKIMMCCTGGIRCEMYSCYMKELGFDEVYQLDGGIIQYGLKQGTKHWKGKLFVFDDRMVIPISEDNDEVISHCQFCGVPADNYYNCANMDCNRLLISCPSCYKKHKGCCSVECQEGRVRPISDNDHSVPFRKLPFEVKQALKPKANAK